MGGLNDWPKYRYQGVPLSPCAKRILADLFNGSALDINNLRVRVGIPALPTRAGVRATSAATTSAGLWTRAGLTSSTCPGGAQRRASSPRAAR